MHKTPVIAGVLFIYRALISSENIQLLKKFLTVIEIDFKL